MDKTQSLYKEFLMDHAQHPRHATLLDSPTHATEEIDRVCGDQVQVTLQVSDDRITNVGIKVDGCALAVAAGSLFADYAIGKSVEEVKTADLTLLSGLMHLDQIPTSRRSCILLVAETTKGLLC